MLRFMGVAALALLLCFALSSRAWADECPSGGQHEYVAELVEQATAERDGSRTFTCIKCGQTYAQTIPKTGHDWGPWIRDVEPTCTGEGHEYRECLRYSDNPHYEDRIVSALSPDGRHAWTEQFRKEPTPQVDGSVTYVCSTCGARYEETLPAAQAEPDKSFDQAARSYNEVGGRTGAHAGRAEGVSQTRGHSNDLAAKELTANEFDVAMALVDAAMLAVFTIATVPLIFQVMWIRRRRREAARASAYATVKARNAS